MQDRHRDRKKYFLEQGITTKKYVIPYIEEVQQITAQSRVLEIGCGEGGNLVPFLELGCEAVGVDLNEGQIEKAKIFVKESLPEAKVKFLYQNIYDSSAADIGKFDVIMLRDVIEHIPEQTKFLKHLKSFLRPKGIVFFGFPPWRMPFGGHQQICNSKLLSKLPYFHLLPKPAYNLILNSFGEKEGTIKELLEIKDTGISISRFQKIVRENGYDFVRNTFFFINPNYEIKFGLKPRLQIGLINGIPYFRDFFTTCCYSIIKMPD